MGGWMDGWMDGWMGGKAGSRIAYSNQKWTGLDSKDYIMLLEYIRFKVFSCLI
jgi:hypothetical protein